MIGILCLILILTAVPFFWGVLVTDDCNAGALYEVFHKYLYGFITITACFFLCYGIFVALSATEILPPTHRYSMSDITRIFSLVLAIGFIVGAVVYYRKKHIKITESIKKAAVDIKTEGNNIYWIIVIIIVVQLIRLIIGQPVEYRDDKSYIAMIGDILYTDRIYGNSIDTGFPQGIHEMQTKWILSPWYHFITYLTGMAGLHPAIVYKLIMPIPLLILTYIAFYEVGKALRLQQSRMGIYMLIVVVAMEVLSGRFDPAIGTLVWPAWGKNPAALVITPLIFITYLRLIDQSHEQPDINRKGHTPLWLLILGIAGCGMTTTCMVTIPIEVGVLSLIYMIKSRQIVKPILTGIIGVIIPIVQFVLYMIISWGWLS